MVIKILVMLLYWNLCGARSTHVARDPHIHNLDMEFLQDRILFNMAMIYAVLLTVSMLLAHV